MSPPGTLAWFARHEARLVWRDFLSLVSAGGRWRFRSVAVAAACVAVLLHAIAYAMLARAPIPTGAPDAETLLVALGAAVAVWSLMLSQGLESVTRAFYARGDLELILSSPAPAARLFAIRLAAMTGSAAAMTLLLAAPFIDVLIWLGGPRWFGAYAAAVAMAMLAMAAATGIAAGLFRLIGPRHTRGIAQILSAVIGAAFAISLQIWAILSFGTIPAMPVPRLAALLLRAPAPDSPLWLPAWAATGEPLPLAVLLACGLGAISAAIVLVAPRFGGLAHAATAPSPALTRHARPFRARSPAWTLRGKEWTLLLRDPWLMSQTLMQLLYLLPAALLVWKDFHGETATIVVPVLIVAAGQLGGGLAWLAVSGEDAPDLIATAPVPAARVLRAKAEAVLGGIFLVFSPLLLMLGIGAPRAAAIASVFIAVAAMSATAIQYWFRSQAGRRLFRRRHTSSRVATVAEAMSSTIWAVAGALAAGGTWLAVVPGGIALVVLAGAWSISPGRGVPMG